MSIRSRLWRLIRSEVNSRLGNFGPSQQPNYSDKAYRYQESETTYTSRSFDPEGSGLNEYYRVLELPDGAGLDEVRAAYKTLMKKYHPDKFQDPEKRAEATELVKKINGAYTELLRALDKD